MNLLSKFLNRTDFSDYDDFRRNAKLCVPSDFNFGFDVVDEYARLCPEKRALVWCNQKGEEKVITFGEMKELSLKMCNVISSYGVKKGDFVMSMLNRRWEYWVLVVACCKMGVVLIPATHMLTPKDVAYRVNEAGVKLLFATEEEDVAEHISLALPDCKNLKGVLSVNGAHFDNLDEKLENAPAEFSFDARPNPRDLMLVYFTSGTTGMPKWSCTTFCILWDTSSPQNTGRTSSTTACTSLWRKRAGQNAAGAKSTVSGYRARRFSPTTTTADLPPRTSCRL